MTKPLFVTGGALLGKVVTRLVDEQQDAEAARARGRISEHIGPYTLVRLLGSGGMGDVYLAERIEANFTQHVALKLVRSGMIDAATRDRFERERQILGGLRHPNIAALLDLGQTADGQPYYTMEYIDGTPITEYCRTRSLLVADRVHLLIQVARALANAHANLVVHRDIKPRNVLVGNDGVAKLLDFGISKLTAIEADSGSTQTVGLLTPEYAAPEQFTGGRVTIATDIYQFGVLCFRILSGRLPYRTDSSDTYRWSKAVVEEEPISLSRALEGGSDQPTGYPVSTLQRTRRYLTKDLDAIVRKTLAKQPADRYRSMNSVIDDLEAFLDDRPVAARHVGAAHLAWRQIKRHSYVSTFALAAILAVLGTAIVALNQAAVARQEAARASLEAKNATEFANFLVALFSVTDPRNNRGAELTANQILDSGKSKVEQELANQPEIQARILSVIGKVYDKLGDHPRSQDSYERALRALAVSHSSDESTRASLLRLLSFQLLLQSDYTNALRHLEEAETSLLKLGAKGAGELGMVESVRGGVYRQRGELAAARSQYEAAARHVQNAGSGYEYYAAMNYYNLGMLLYETADFRESRKSFERSIEFFAKTEGQNSVDVLSGRAFLGRVSIAEGDLEQARELLEPAVQGLLELKSEWANSFSMSLGELYRRSGECSKSSTVLAEASDRIRQRNGEQSAWYAEALRQQGLTELARGDTRSGIALIRQAAGIDEALFSTTGASLASSRLAMAIGSLAEKHFDLAKDYSQQALSAIDTPAQRDDPLKAETLYVIGYSNHALGDEDAARSNWAKSVELSSRVSGGESSPAVRQLRDRISSPNLSAVVGVCLN